MLQLIRVYICFATSEVVELGIQCSLNLDFRDLSVSPTYVASHSSHLILYTGPTTFSLSTGSLGLTNSWRNALKYVGMPYFPHSPTHRPLSAHHCVLVGQGSLPQQMIYFNQPLSTYVHNDEIGRKTAIADDIYHYPE